MTVWLWQMQLLVDMGMCKQSGDWRLRRVYVGFRCQVVAPCCGNVYPCKKCHDAEEDHVLEAQKVEQMVCMACNLQQPSAGAQPTHPPNECSSLLLRPSVSAAIPMEHDLLLTDLGFTVRV